MADDSGRSSPDHKTRRGNPGGDDGVEPNPDGDDFTEWDPEGSGSPQGGVTVTEPSDSVKDPQIGVPGRETPPISETIGAKFAAIGSRMGTTAAKAAKTAWKKAQIAAGRDVEEGETAERER